MIRGRVWLLGLVVAAFLAPAPAPAHPLAPALLELRVVGEEAGDERVAVRFKTSRYRVPGAVLSPELPPSCVLDGPPAVSDDASSQTRRLQATCPGGLVGRRVGVAGLAANGIDALLRVELADGRVVQQVLRPDAQSVLVPERPGKLDVAAGYTRMGFEHILSGLDHLLFVFGLMLLVARLRALVLTLTAFTIGHSITLAAAVLGLVRVPSGPVEVLIAASVLYLAVELARARREGRPAATLPWLLAGSFGLLHGLGFAGALSEAGLPEGEIPLALLAFNVGIELGQLAFVGLVLGVSLLLRPAVARLPAAAAWGPIYLMGALSAYWCFERVATLL